MPRNAEVVRQWTVLREIEASRFGTTIDELADLTSVCTRTTRRDLEALQEAGFPIYDERTDGKARWKLDQAPFKVLSETGFTLSEACALYFSRSLLEGLAGTPFRSDLSQAFKKIEAALKPAMRKFLDKLPAVLAAKRPAGRRRDGGTADRDAVATLLDAILRSRRVEMRYHSFSSGRVKDYVIEPYQVVYAQGTIYLFAFVPVYQQIRTFAIERIKKLGVLEETFVAVERNLTSEVFPNSLGIHSGTPVHVTLEFAAPIAPYIRQREWHRSQVVTDQADGSVVLQMDVCDDYALRQWVLGFGRLVRVVEPAALAAGILDELERARENYQPALEFDVPPARLESRSQRILPFPGLTRAPGPDSRRAS
jgi:predicted DNA-binding transcriptional regulator YafY